LEFRTHYSMGCLGSKGVEQEQVGKNRRRLSVDQGEGVADLESVELTEDERGMITGLKHEAILDLINDKIEGPKMSMCSNTDQGQVSFADKGLSKLGDCVDAAQCGLGYTCRKGLKPESPNQDSFFVLKTDRCSIYGVFDGHGMKGHDVSNFVKENLPRMIVKDQRFMSTDRKQLLKEAFKKTQAMVSEADTKDSISAKLSGTTATVAIHDHQNRTITIAHVADSTAVLGKMKPGSQDPKELIGEALTKDHKPNLKEERTRIESNGGRVVFDGYANHRIYAKNARYPGLNMSRCIGDLMGHQDCGIIAEPDVVEIPVTNDLRWLLLCSDGVWEFIDPQEAVELIAEIEPTKAMDGAQKLAKEAWDRWIREEGGAVVDDITVVLVALNLGSQS